MSDLHTLPIDTLKIDRAFLTELEKEERSSHLVRTIVSVAHTLGMDLVAEGAETAEHVEALREIGSEFAQGYFFARPQDAHEIDALIDQGPFLHFARAGKHLKLVQQAS